MDPFAKEVKSFHRENKKAIMEKVGLDRSSRLPPEDLNLPAGKEAIELKIVIILTLVSLIVTEAW